MTPAVIGGIDVGAVAILALVAIPIYFGVCHSRGANFCSSGAREMMAIAD
jgi:hypothetical protein